MKALKILVLLILTALFGWFSIDVVHAEDYGQEITITSSDVSLNLYGYYYVGNSTPQAFSGSTNYVRSDLRAWQIQTGSGWDSAFQCAQSYQENASRLPLLNKVFNSVNNGNVDAINISDVSFTIDYTLPSLAGWYTCTYDIYLGVGVGFPRNNRASYCVNSFTVDGSADFYTDSDGHPFILQYLDTTQSTFSAGGNTMRFDLLHFRAIYQGDHIEETLSLNLYDYLRTHIAGWQASGVYGNGYSIAGYTFQAFTDMHVYYMNEPPATPTPIPTPYPGQDTQESINAGVQQIVQGLDVQATPIPTPADLTIDETVFDALNDLTLPDVSPAEQTFTNLWAIFTPLMPFIVGLAGSLLFAGIFMYCLRGHFI